MPFTEKYPKSIAVIGPAAVYTADVGGDTTHTVDAALNQVDDYWNGRYIKYLTGDNAGLERLITDFDDLTDTLTHDAFPNTCDAGDTYILGGWVNPDNAKQFDNSVAYCETNTGEQAYTSFGLNLKGVEDLDKVFARIKWTSKVTGVVAGNNATATMTLRVYDGSSWTNKQVTKTVFATDTANNALTDTIGDNSNSDQYVDITSIINTKEKLADTQFALLFAVAADAGITVRWSVDGVSLLAIYHVKAGIPMGKAITKKDIDAESLATIKTVTASLRALS